LNENVNSDRLIRKTPADRLAFLIQFIAWRSARAGSNLLPVRSNLSQDFFDADLVNRLYPARSYAQPNPAIFAWNPKSVPLQIGLEPAFCFVVCVRDIVTGQGFLASHLTFLSHDNDPPKMVMIAKRGTISQTPVAGEPGAIIWRT
jgi:hypothetical protein